MEKLENLYYEVENPLANVDNIKELFLTYILAGKKPDALYSRIIDDYSPVKPTSKNKENYFYSFLFKLWKKQFSKLIIKPTDFEHLETNESLKELLALGTYKDLTTKDEILNFFAKQKEGIAKNFNFIHEESTWSYIFSDHFSFAKKKIDDVKHRLYLNLDKDDIYTFCTLFIEKCEDENIPFRFKFNKDGYRKDNIVIYSSDKYIIKHQKIVEEIFKEHKDILKNAKKPAIIVGKIKEKIGYGREPKEHQAGSSYTTNRLNAISEIFNQTFDEWLNETNVIVNDRKISVKKYIYDKTVDYCIKNNLKIDGEISCLERIIGYKGETINTPGEDLGPDAHDQIFTYVTNLIISLDKDFLINLQRELKEKLPEYEIDGNNISFNADDLVHFQNYEPEAEKPKQTILQTSEDDVITFIHKENLYLLSNRQRPEDSKNKIINMLSKPYSQYIKDVVYSVISPNRYIIKNTQIEFTVDNDYKYTFEEQPDFMHIYHISREADNSSSKPKHMKKI